MSTLTNLRPFPKGSSPNPGGRPKDHYRRLLERIAKARVQSLDGKSMARLERLIEKAFTKAELLLDHSPRGLEQVMPFLIMLRDTLDGKLQDQQQGTASQDQRVFLVGGGVTKAEEVQLVPDAVKIEPPDSH